MNWPLVTRTQMTRKATLARNLGWADGFAKGIASQNQVLAAEWRRTTDLIKELIRFTVSPDAQANSDTVTLFFPKMMKQLKGDEGYAQFVADQVGKAVYEIITRSQTR